MITEFRVDGRHMSPKAIVKRWPTKRPSEFRVADVRCMNPGVLPKVGLMKGPGEPC